MTERLEELIVAYLHRGSTPEQDQELFEACRTNPEAADLLRRHVVLSLKLRDLRERTAVPAETRNALVRRINEVEAELRAAAPASPPSVRPARRFGWAHLVGGALAAAAAVTLAFVLIRPAAPAPSTVTLTVPVHDTVLLSKTDTLIHVRYVRENIARTDVPRTREPERGVELPDNDVSANREPAPVPTDEPKLDRVPERAPNIDVDAMPAFAENRTRDTISYITQYTAMIASVDKVRLTADDRVRN